MLNGEWCMPRLRNLFIGLLVLLLSTSCGTTVPKNHAPLVGAGKDRSVDVGIPVMLQGEASDAEGDTLSVLWKITAKPENSQSILTKPKQLSSSFIPDKPGVYEITLTVSDLKNTSTDTTVITANAVNHPPIVDAGANQTVNLGEVVNLTANAADIDGDQVNFMWSMQDKPEKSTITFESTQQNPSFTPDCVGQYRIRVQVSDGVHIVTDDLIITIIQELPLNQPPVVDAGVNQTRSVGDTVLLEGQASDPDGDDLNYVWSILDRPIGSNAVLQDMTILETSFVADKAGAYVLELEVSDTHHVVTDSLTITVVDDTVNNEAPQLSRIEGRKLLLDEEVSIAFTILDEDPASVIVEARSSNQSILPNSQMTLSGSSVNRTLTLRSGFETGVVTITLTAEDREGLQDVSSFTLSIVKPFETFQKLVSPTPTANDEFGYSVAMTDSYALVGAHQADHRGSDSGAAYLYSRNADTWQYQQTLSAGDGKSLDNFGHALTVTDSLAVVSALLGDGVTADTGAVYVYRRNGSTWTEQQKIIADDGEAGDEFGWVLKAQGDYLFVGADEDDNTGSVYIFKFNGTQYQQIQKLQPALSRGSRFGRSLSIFNMTLMVGTPGDDTNGEDAGAVYVYQQSGDTWVLKSKLIASDGTPGDRFGRSIAFNQRYAIISAVYDDMLGSYAGSAYVFELVNGVWTERQKLTGSDTDDQDRFGHTVGLQGDYVMIGAYGSKETGAAYVYKHTDNNWVQVNRLQPADARARDRLGSEGQMTDTFIITGAREHDSGAANAGAVYIFNKR